MRLSTLLLVTALTSLVVLPAGAQTEVTGQTANGSYYKIAVPAGWQPADGLVIWSHGFDLSPIDPVTDLGPLSDLQLLEGYAVAASSYSQTGWSLFQTVQDTRQMVEAFEDLFGTPEQIILHGASLGGLVTAQLVEKGQLPNVVGAYPICGAVAGSRVWDAGLDFLVLYDAICRNVPGATLPGVFGPAPFPPNPKTPSQDVASALSMCFGLFTPPAGRTVEQADRLAQFLTATGIPENFVATDMGFAIFGLGDLFLDPKKLNQRSAFTNKDVDYGDATLNAQVTRIVSDPFDRLFLHENYTPAGQVGSVKIVSIHTDKDGLVLVENESEYQSLVPAANLTVAVAVEDTPTHCGFTAAELVAGWESLRGWIAGLPQPTAASWQATCQALEAGDLAQGPCRIDPGFLIPDLDDRVRPRLADGGEPLTCQEDGETLCLQQNRFQVRIQYKDPGGSGGPGHARPLETDTGAFWFRRAPNLEVTTKILDGRARNGHFWVFYASMTNVEFTLEVTDTETGAQKIYKNAQGTVASEADTKAF